MQPVVAPTATPPVDGVVQYDAELDSVRKVYPDGTVAVDGVSLAIRRGELFSLLGPSGCGKSTTLRLIAGLERLTGGRILIRGADVGAVPANRRPTNMVFQQLALFPHLSVEQNVGFGLRLRRVPRARAAERIASALALVELTGLERRMPGQLSGGQQQRVAIARALVNEPAVLLLDEPFAALDLRLRLQMQRALKDIQRAANTTFVFVTHDQHEAMTLSDRIAVMDQGRVLQVGTPQEIYERPTTRFVARFIGDANLFETPVRDGTAEIGGVRVHADGDGVAFAVRPERLRILPRDAGGAPGGAPGNVLDATVVERTFLGATTRYVVRTDGGATLTAQAPNASEGHRHEPGERVRVGWPREAAIVLPE